MVQETPSFWVEIKKYEDILARDPNSYCFAPLAELYRKLGMLDDAINIAKKGCEMHLEYVGGFMALGRAYFEKGMMIESRVALEKVVRGTPDNLLAQRLLSQIYIDAGEIDAAEKTLKTIIFQNPGDIECQILLDSLARTVGVLKQAVVDPNSEESGTGFGEAENSDYGFLPEEEADGAFDLDDAEIVEEFEDLEVSKVICPEKSPESVAEFAIDGEPRGKDPLNTTTLAELYVSQGFLKRALTIYRELLLADPDNMELKNRLVELEQEIDLDNKRSHEHSLEHGFVGTDTEEAVEGLFDLPASAMPGNWSMANTGSEWVIDPNGEEATGHTYALGLETQGLSVQQEDLSPMYAGQDVVRILEGWLENIRRRQ